jgi:hypothetical protein
LAFMVPVVMAGSGARKRTKSTLGYALLVTFQTHKHQA